MLGQIQKHKVPRLRFPLRFAVRKSLLGMTLENSRGCANKKARRGRVNVEVQRVQNVQGTGRVGRAGFYGDGSENGIRVSKPWGDSSSFDVGVEAGERILREIGRAHV